MVLPNAAVDREQFSGFRSGNYSGRAGALCLSFDGSWDLRRIRPHFFPRGASVIFARRTDNPTVLNETTMVWRGRLGRVNCSWAVARGELAREMGSLTRTDGSPKSEFASRFSQGATFNPRLLFIVAEREAGPLGLPAGRMGIESSRSANEKTPYKDLPSVHGVVETEFVRPVYSGENLFPYRVVAPLQAVVPCSSSRLLTPREIELHPGLRNWWAQAEQVWEANRAPATKLSLMEQLDYQSKMTKQLPVAPFRIVYNASGMHLAASKIQNTRAIVSKSLYWAAFREEAEADFLCAILNSSATTEFLRPLMSYGKDERHVDKHLWQLPIPSYDSENSAHQELVSTSRQASDIANEFSIDPTLHFAATRRRIRQLIDNSQAGTRISEIVHDLLS